MRHIIWEEQETYGVAVLVKASSFNKGEIERNYIQPLEALGVPKSELISFSLKYNDMGKAPVAFIKEYLAELLPALNELRVKQLLVTDSTYFKVLAGQSKAEPHHGYALPCKIKGYEHIQVILGLNYQALIYDPALQEKLDLSIRVTTAAFRGAYQPPGQGIIHSAQYPESLGSIQAALKALHQYPSLSVDIEAFSLAFDRAGIGTITFCWDEHNGIAFRCDYEPVHDGTAHGRFVPSPAVRSLLREFFETYQGELVFHHAAYDVKVLIYCLWMKNLIDTPGLLKGLEVLTKRFHDTKIIAYLATNTTAGNVLGLKALAQEFAGNWAVEVNDICKVPLTKLLQYNLVDGLCTNYVRKKYQPIMVTDQQEQLYNELMLPSLKLIIQIELTGMPLNPTKVKEVRQKLEAIRDAHLDTLLNSQAVQAFNSVLQHSLMVKANAKLKVKQHPLSKFAGEVLNPNSGPQLQRLLYEQMGLPVIDLTDTKMPATGAETLEKLFNHAQTAEHKAILEALIGYSKAEKILSTFIPAFEAAVDKGDGVVWLHGCFNLGGTVSGRLSSSDPNMQNIPANSVYAKLIKECFVGPVGWLFCGADFNSLEDYVSALTTKDPNKLAVYEQGFDGHCLRAAYYFRDQCPDIDPTDPVSVNSMKKKYPGLRQDSKGPTFALTYQGTWHTLVNNLGFPEEKAKAIETGYHELYKVSDQYVQTRLKQATKDGFVTVAFGLRVRTPLLSQVVWGSRIPYEAAAEGRTAGNAMGQSYGLLNNRAAVAFFKKVWASKYRYDILPVALIHDAIYILVRDDAEVMEWANRELIKAMQWQELPELQHPTVKLGAALDIFWPSWAKATTLPNNASQEQIREICRTTRTAVLQPA